MNAMNVTPNSSALTTEVDYMGPIAGRPAFDFMNGSRTNINLQRAPANIVNARTLSDPPTLEREGMAVLKHKTSISLDGDIEQFRPVYFAEMCDFLKEVTGAYLVIPQGIRGLMIRRPPVEGRPFFLQMKGTRIAHLDFTKSSFDKWRDYAIQGAGVDPGKYSRVICMQTWRMMAEPPQNETLGLVDARTYSRDDGIVVDSIISNDDRETFEIVGLRPHNRYRWLYWSNLTRDEVLLFKGWDTDSNYPIDVPHQAITDPLAGPDAHPRQSIESRFYCFLR